MSNALLSYFHVCINSTCSHSANWPVAMSQRRCWSTAFYPFSILKVQSLPCDNEVILRCYSAVLRHMYWCYLRTIKLTCKTPMPWTLLCALLYINLLKLWVLSPSVVLSESWLRRRLSSRLGSRSSAGNGG